MKPIKPGQKAAPQSDQEKKNSQAEIDRYHAEILAARPHELDADDQRELQRMIQVGIKAGALRGDI